VRGLPRHGLPCLAVLLFFALVFSQGCARSVLQTYPASEQEFASALAAFARYQKISEAVCACCLDAEADAALSVSGLFSNHTGKLSGYLQAMKPGYLKFVALNPLGQPMIIFVTDGDNFKSLDVFAGKAYLGSVHSEVYKKYAPAGFEPQFAYYLLTGRLQPEDMRIEAVMRDREGDKFWLQIKHANAKTDSMVLFDPGEMLILRHVVRDERGEHLVDIGYADYRLVPGKGDKYAGNAPAAISAPDTGKESCMLPASITVSANGNAGKIEVTLDAFLDDARFSAEDFIVKIPDNFEQLFVQ
jgi:hypothetical protein